MLHTLTAIKKKLLRGPKSHFWSESCSEGGLKYTWVLMRESLPRVWDGDNLLYILNPHPSQVQWWIREGTGSLKAWVISPSLWVTQSLPHPAQRGSCRGKKKKQGERERSDQANSNGISVNFFLLLTFQVSWESFLEQEGHKKMFLSSQLLNIEGTGKLRKGLSLSKCLRLFRRIRFGFFIHTLLTEKSAQPKSWELYCIPWNGRQFLRLLWGTVPKR